MLTTPKDTMYRTAACASGPSEADLGITSTAKQLRTKIIDGSEAKDRR
jgi:hypothetical protein